MCIKSGPSMEIKAEEKDRDMQGRKEGSGVKSEVMMIIRHGCQIHPSMYPA